MATVGGAQAMGLTDCDVLAPGKQADMIVIDLQRPNMQPVHNVPCNLVYSGSKENVRLTMVAGRVLYENGAFFVGEPVPGHLPRRGRGLCLRCALSSDRFSCGLRGGESRLR